MSEYLKLVKTGGSLPLQRKLLSACVAEIAWYGAEVLQRGMRLWQTDLGGEWWSTIINIMMAMIMMMSGDVLRARVVSLPLPAAISRRPCGPPPPLHLMVPRMMVPE